MKDEIQKLMDQIKETFPKGCDGFDCDDCPLSEGTEDDGREGLCDAIQNLPRPH